MALGVQDRLELAGQTLSDGQHFAPYRVNVRGRSVDRAGSAWVGRLPWIRWDGRMLITAAGTVVVGLGVLLLTPRARIAVRWMCGTRVMCEPSRFRGPPLASLLLVLVLAAACISNPERAEMTFNNTSDVPVCFHPSSVTGQRGGIAETEDVAVAGRACDEIKPRAVSSRDTGCGYGDSARNHLVTVRLTAGPGGQRIYEKTVACFEWQDAHATFIIKRRGNEFVVTDSLPGETPTLSPSRAG